MASRTPVVPPPPAIARQRLVSELDRQRLAVQPHRRLLLTQPVLPVHAPMPEAHPAQRAPAHPVQLPAEACPVEDPVQLLRRARPPADPAEHIALAAAIVVALPVRPVALIVEVHHPLA